MTIEKQETGATMTVEEALTLLWFIADDWLLERITRLDVDRIRRIKSALDVSHEFITNYED